MGLPRRAHDRRLPGGARPRRAVVVALVDRRDRGGHGRRPDEVRGDQRHRSPARSPLPVAPVGARRVCRGRHHRDPLQRAGALQPDARERPAEVDRVLPALPDHRRRALRADDRCRQLRPRAGQLGAGRHPPAQPSGADRAGLRPARERRQRHAGAAQPAAHPLRRADHGVQHPRRAAARPVSRAPVHAGAGRQGAGGLREGVGAHPQASGRHAAHGDRALQEGAGRQDRRGQRGAQQGAQGRRPDARGARDRGAAGALRDRDPGAHQPRGGPG